jgi:amino acid adenylation domain-containing protein
MSLSGQRVLGASRPFAHEVFESHAALYPERIALTYNQLTFSYRELNARANQFAHYLTSRGPQIDTAVGVCLDRSPEMIISILGTLKAGAAYAPLDPTYPPARLRLMISQLPCMDLIVASPSTISMVDHSDADVVDMENLGPQLSSLPITKPLVEVSAEDLCYVVFTSGSTGTPKATAVKHRGWYNLLNWLAKEFKLDTHSSNLLMSPLGFDISQRSLIMPLFTGSALHLLPSRSFDVMMACRLIKGLRVRTLHCAPSALYLLLDRAEAEGGDALASLDFVFVGGEPLAAGRVANWATRAANACSLVNVYGVAECTDVASAHVLINYPAYVSGGVPIGRPIYNVDIHVLDSDLSHVASGDVGEICISGLGVGAGYLNDTRIGEERFVTARFENGTVDVYRTGDLGRVRPDGELMYVGRADNQVKVRGMRVDLGDVEAALHGNVHIREAVVLPVHDDGSQETDLVALVVPAGQDGVLPSEKDFDAWAVRSELLQVLPRHMIPQRFIPVPALPLSPNGKVDRRVLAQRLYQSVPAVSDSAGVPGIPLQPQSH